ncbi:YwqG family protein [Oceanivirga salmonicida]|uniref:YwqG family protein n=1 Tax=Oceanivirga salmonicida TaxID=1769291 RepID=UPI0012E14F65|nr:YwqG family protein [Oceanivirga salmonicida]
MINFFKNLFKKDKVENKKTKIIEELRKETLKESILINVKESDNIELTASKFGGYPYIPFDENVPLDSNGDPLYLIAQINCSDLPENNIYPKKGLLQFFIGTDDLWGLDFDNQISGQGHKVIYYENIDKNVTQEDVMKKYKLEEYVEMPLDIETTLALSFGKEMQAIEYNTLGFDEMFIKKYNKYFPKNKIEDIWDIDDDFMDEISEEFLSFQSRIGGYPSFTQSDMREDDNILDKYNILLLQIDSNNDYIMWGDSGIANFFITKEMLDKKDFTKVLYNWDCY